MQTGEAAHIALAPGRDPAGKPVLLFLQMSLQTGKFLFLLGLDPGGPVVEFGIAAG